MAQGTVEQKTTDKEAERFICIASIPIKENVGYSVMVFDIPEGARWVKDKRRKINLYKGARPESNGYTRIPEGVKIGEYRGYKDRGEHTIPGEFSFR
ncbi:hypothetical protein KY345_01990 [Candidatus Woesearchaeota archaeon]|nr:hypothetical protein [Candidatus Woesearchaeota archaeon]